MVWERFQVSPLMHGFCPSNSKLFWDAPLTTTTSPWGSHVESGDCMLHTIQALHLNKHTTCITAYPNTCSQPKCSTVWLTIHWLGHIVPLKRGEKHFESRHFLRWPVGTWAWHFSMERSILQGGPLVVIDGVITPLIGVITPVTYLFSLVWRLYQGHNCPVFLSASG